MTMIRVTQISQVSPKIDSVDSLVLPLTLFDLKWLNLRQIKRVIFYKLSELSPESFYSVILPKLEKSLSAVLRHYLPLAGHLTWDPQDPKPCIFVLPEDTASLTVAETNADFSSVSSKGLRPAKEIRSLVPELPVSGGSPALLSLQVTLFPNQGLSVGIATNHAFADAKTAQRFIKSWTYFCKHGGSMALPDDLTPSLDRTVVVVPNSMELEAKMLRFHGYSPEDKESTRTFKVLSTKDVDADIFRCTLELTVENVEKLKKRAKNGSHHDELHVSTFVVVYAYIWSCLIKARVGDVDRQVAFGYTVDMRNRLDPPVPETYLGNCVFPMRCSGYKAKQFMGGDGFVKAVEIISVSVKGLRTQGIEGLMDLFVDSMKNIEDGTEVWGVIGSHRDQIYEMDFGWGRPVNCEIVSTDQSQYLSMSGRSDAKCGVEIGLCLKKSEMDVFISLFENGLED